MRRGMIGQSERNNLLPSLSAWQLVSTCQQLLVQCDRAFRFVPEKQACVVERCGRFNRVMGPGLGFTVPLLESVAYTHSLKELTLTVNTQQAITKDNVTIRIDGVLYIRIIDPFKASYGVDKPLYAVMQLAQTSMRSELGKMTLDNTFNERDALNHKIVRARAP
jgi:regulator of protease activity HflC (stomatin/prohibitin superfamily)